MNTTTIAGDRIPPGTTRDIYEQVAEALDCQLATADWRDWPVLCTEDEQVQVAWDIEKNSDLDPGDMKRFLNVLQAEPNEPIGYRRLLSSTDAKQVAACARATAAGRRFLVVLTKPDDAL